MNQNTFFVHCISMLRTKALELKQSRTRNRKSGLSRLEISAIDALEARVLLTSDFGDAPANYPVTLTEDGARHTATGPKLGLTVDSEADGVHSAESDADGSEDDGVVFGVVNAGRPDAGVVVKVRNAALGTKLDAWVDFNADGDWNDTGEQIFDSVTVLNNTDQRLTFSVPDDAILGTTFARFRISSAGGLSPTGDAPDGEVEDHKVAIGLAAPTVLSPAASALVNVTGTHRVTFSWTSVPQAVNYEIWVRSHNYLPQTEFHRTTVNDTSYTPNMDFGIGNYSVWVRSLGSNNAVSSWSPVRQFSVGAKTTITPMTKMQPTARPTVTWAPVLGAESYKVWISNLSTGKSPVILQEGLTQTSFTPSSSLPIGVYRVWVAAISGSKTVGWSLPVDIQIAPAPISSPTTPTLLTSTYSWSSVLGATSYEFQMKNVKTGAIVLSNSVVGTSWTPGTVLFSGEQYRWWVRAKSAQGVYTLWSAPTTFVAGGQTTVLTPAGTSNNTMPNFTWQAVEGAVRYEFLLHRVDVGTAIINKKDVLTNSFTPAVPLASGTYRVWVRAVAASGVMSTWSVPVTFTITRTDATLEDQTEIPQLLFALLDSTSTASEVAISRAAGDRHATAAESQRADHPSETEASIQAAASVEPLSIPFDTNSSQWPQAVELIDMAISAWMERPVDTV